MASDSSVTPRIVTLAERLIADISARNLGPGDRYLTTADASKLLGVSNGLANRALQLLERRQIISRQQRRGAFVLSLPGEHDLPPLHRVHFLVHPQFLRTEGIANDSLLLGIQSELPGAHVQISFLPAEDEVGFVRQLIGTSLASEITDGFILTRAKSETQRLVAGCGVPAVVYGSVFPGVGSLASLERDMAAGGRKLIRFLIERGHERFAYFNRQITFPGDHLTMDAIADELADSGFRSSALVQRFLPADTDVCIAEVRRLLEGPRPTGFICRTVRMAEAVAAAIEQLGLRRCDFDIAVCDYFLRDGDRPQFAHAKPRDSNEEQGKHLARLLLQRLRDPSQPAEQLVIPVELELPEAEGQR